MVPNNASGVIPDSAFHSIPRLKDFFGGRVCIQSERWHGEIVATPNCQASSHGGAHRGKLLSGMLLAGSVDAPG